MDWSQFWQNAGANTVGSLVGTLAGVAGALWVNRRADASRRASERAVEQQRREEREAEQWRIAHWQVGENIKLARQAIDVIDADKRFVFPMNTHLLNVATAELARLTDDSRSLYHLEHFRYQLLHVDEQVQARNAVGTERSDTGEWHNFASDITHVLRTHLDEVIDAGQKLLPSLQKQMQRLSRHQLPRIGPSA